MPQVQNTVVHEVAGARLDQEDFLVRKVFCETRGDDTALQSESEIPVSMSFGVTWCMGRDIREDAFIDLLSHSKRRASWDQREQIEFKLMTYSCATANNEIVIAAGL